MATVEKLLSTTRSVRKRLDLTKPVDLDTVRECLDLAIQAPSGSNTQTWKFLLITDEEKRKAIGDIYARSFEIYVKETSANAPQLPPEDPRAQRLMKVVSSAVHLSENFAKVPLFVLCCLEGRVENASVFEQASFYGSILPSTWSLMLAMRAKGLGSAWTTLHLRYEQEVAELLGIPENYTQACLLPVAYFTGEDFRAAKRVPTEKVSYLDSWGSPAFS